MPHNFVQQGLARVPSWVIQVLLGVVLSSIIAWGSWATVATMKQEVKIAKVEVRTDDVQADVRDIKEALREVNRKLDRLLERKVGR